METDSGIDAPKKGWEKFLSFIFNGRTGRICLLSGIGFILLSICASATFGCERHLGVTMVPHNQNIPLFSFGCLLTLAGLGISCIRVFLNYFAELTVWMRVTPASLELGDGHGIDITWGKIQDVHQTADEAVLLPINASLDSKCFEDRHSSCGAYMAEHFSGRVKEIYDAIKKSFEANRGEKVQIGETVFYNTDGEALLITAATDDSHGNIRTNEQNLRKALRNVFAQAATSRIVTIHAPIIGAGHGGLKEPIAICTMIIEFIHCCVTGEHHHVRRLHIVCWAEKPHLDFFRHLRLARELKDKDRKGE